MAFGDITQSASDVTHDAEYPDTFDVTLGSGITEGSLLIALHFTGASNSIGPGGWTEAFSLTDAGNTDQGAMYYKIAGSGENTTITCTSNAGDEHMLSVMEVEGPWNGTPEDVESKSSEPDATDAGGDLSTGTSGSTAQNDEFAAAMWTIRDAWMQAASWSGLTNSFTELHDIYSQFKSFCSAYKVLSSTGTVEVTNTSAYTSTTAMAGVQTFKKSVGGRTTYNTDPRPLGLFLGVSHRIGQT